MGFMAQKSGRTSRIAVNAAALLLLSTAGAVLPAQVASATATTTYIDCSRPTSGDGSQTAPYNSLAPVNSRVFSAGDTIALAAGTACTGTLSPQGGGSSTTHVTITSYGTGALPVINGNGALAAITLTNQDNWTVRNLSLTNPALTETQRDGIWVTATDGKAHTGYDIGNLTVDRVAGQTDKDAHTKDFVHSSGIEFDTANTDSTLNNVHIHDNQVSNTGGGGIKIRVGSLSTQGSGVLIENNTVTAAGGDGIIASYAESPVIQYNTAARLGTGVYPWTAGNFAGMWVLGDHDPTLQYNVVHDSIMSAFDSEAFDCDWGNSGTCLVQDNYSHDNAGGLFLNCDGCGTSGAPTEVVRYNIAQNDCRTISNGNAATLWFYNNTIYCPNTKFNINLPSTSHMENNIWVGTTGSTLPTYGNISWRWNMFQGVPRPTANGIVGDPGFVNPGSGGDTLHSVDGYKLKATSTGLLNGALMSNNGKLDFWGNTVSSTAKPNRGAYDGPGV